MSTQTQTSPSQLNFFAVSGLSPPAESFETWDDAYQAAVSQAQRLLSRPMTDKQIRATAYHEAGHAVAALFLGLKFSWVLVRRHADPVVTAEGETFLAQVDADFGKVRQVHGGLLAIFKAAESGKPLTEKQRERLKNQIIVLFAGGCAEHKHTGRWNRIGYSGDQAEIVRFAKEYEIPKDELDDYGALARWFVDNYFEYIEAVAEALIEKRSLRSDQVRRIMAKVAKAQVAA